MLAESVCLRGLPFGWNPGKFCCYHDVINVSGKSGTFDARRRDLMKKIIYMIFILIFLYTIPCFGLIDCEQIKLEYEQIKESYKQACEADKEVKQLLKNRVGFTTMEMITKDPNYIESQSNYENAMRSGDENLEDLAKKRFKEVEQKIWDKIKKSEEVSSLSRRKDELDVLDGVMDDKIDCERYEKREEEKITIERDEKIRQLKEKLAIERSHQQNIADYEKLTRKEIVQKHQSLASKKEIECLNALLEYQLAKISYELNKGSLEEIEKTREKYLKIRDKLLKEKKLKDKFLAKKILIEAAIDAHKPCIGMDILDAERALGKPNEINRTTGSWGIHEQWVYRDKNMYVYFENGEITTWQNHLEMKN
jgi:hypothetical protein